MVYPNHSSFADRIPVLLDILQQPQELSKEDEHILNKEKNEGKHEQDEHDSTINININTEKDSMPSSLIQMIAWNDELEEAVRLAPSSMFRQPSNNNNNNSSNNGKNKYNTDLEHIQQEEAERVSHQISQLSTLLHRELLILLRYIYGYDNHDSDNNQPLEQKDEEALNLAMKIDKENEYVQKETTIMHLSTLMQTIKNVLRCMHHYVLLNSHIPCIQKQAYETNPPLQLLKSKGIVALYLSLLDKFAIFHINKHPSPSDNNNDSTQNIILHSSNVARYASHAVFHSIFGSTDVTSKKALSFFLSDQLNGIPIIMKVSLLPNHVSLLTSLMKIIHHMLGTNPSLYKDMNEALTHMIVHHQNPSVFPSHDLNSSSKPSDSDSKDTSFPTNILLPKHDQHFPMDSLDAILVCTLAYTVRHVPKTSEQSTSTAIWEAIDTDLRPELALEILNILFILQSIHAKKKQLKQQNETENEIIMTQMGILLVDILHQPHPSKRMYKLKLAVVNLLLDTPDSYSHYLYINQALPALWNILELQLEEVMLNDTTHGKSSDAVTLLPILIAWKKLAKANPLILQFSQAKIFPSNDNEQEEEPTKEDDKHEKQQQRHQQQQQEEGKHPDPSMSTISSSKKEEKVKPKKNNMAPADAPKGTIRYKLIQLMTWLESNVKRAASELLWIVCEENPSIFVQRTGFGNAVHLLGLKGLVDLPSSK